MTYSVVDVGDEQNQVLSIIHTSDDGGQQVIALQVTPGYADKIATFLNTENQGGTQEPVTGYKSPQEALIDVLRSNKSTDYVLGWMQLEGQSLVLNWGEDNNLYECSFISGHGKRFNSVGSTVRKAIRECIKKMAQEELGMEPFQFKSLEDY